MPLEPGELAACEQVEVVDQPRHARVVAVGLARLQREALAERACADPGRVERLHRRERLLDLRERHAEVGRDLAQRGGEIAGLVEQPDQVHGDEQDLADRRRPRRSAPRGARRASARRRRARQCRALPRRRRRRRLPSRRCRGRGRAPWDRCRAARRPRPGRAGSARRRSVRASGSSDVSPAAGRSTVSSPASSSGLLSSASPMKVSISRLDSASSLIACCSCGVITSDWDCRRSSLGPSAIGQLAAPPAARA